MRTHYIYVIRNTINNWVYVGMTTRTVEIRWQEHLKSAENGTDRRLYRGMRKHGVENFHIETIAVMQFMKNDKVAIQLEKFYIKQFNSYWFGYNDTVGGKGWRYNRPKRGRKGT